mmetsp:Transcript_11142/g.31112  ORF Transcript_11142/g.31112 Transcript_11142/m.31112 type:complete len:311 (+) Transcript_11142:2-934(+)
MMWRSTSPTFRTPPSTGQYADLSTVRIMPPVVFLSVAFTIVVTITGRNSDIVSTRRDVHRYPQDVCRTTASKATSLTCSPGSSHKSVEPLLRFLILLAWMLLTISLGNLRPDVHPHTAPLLASTRTNALHDDVLEARVKGQLQPIVPNVTPCKSHCFHTFCHRSRSNCCDDDFTILSEAFRNRPTQGRRVVLPRHLHVRLLLRGSNESWQWLRTAHACLTQRLSDFRRDNNSNDHEGVALPRAVHGSVRLNLHNSCGKVQAICCKVRSCNGQGLHAMVQAIPSHCRCHEHVVVPQGLGQRPSDALNVGAR